MITSYNIEISMRMFLIQKYGLPVVLRKIGWRVPDTKPFYTVNSPTTNHLNLTKNKELVRGIVLLEIGCFADSIRELNELQTNVKQDILYETIPLLDSEGNKVGSFSFTEIVGDTEFLDDTMEVHNETIRNRRYIETRAEIAYVKQ